MYAAQLEDYAKATEIYEEVAKTSMENPLLKYSAKDYFFKVTGSIGVMFLEGALCLIVVFRGVL